MNTNNYDWKRNPSPKCKNMKRYKRNYYLDHIEIYKERNKILNAKWSRIRSQRRNSKDSKDSDIQNNKIELVKVSKKESDPINDLRKIFNYELN